MCPNDVSDSILALLVSNVCNKYGRATYPEQTVWKQHRVVVSLIEVLGDILRRYMQRIFVLFLLHKMVDQVYTTGTSRTPHTAQREIVDSVLHFEFIDNHRTQRRGRTKERTISNKYINVRGFYPSSFE